ncbi:MAG: hypothetical protein IJ094_13035 [Bacilli bacterium]|nr:hypothetical protein [Bacilli bacterium]
MKIYYVKIKLTEEQIYEIIPKLPEEIADSIIEQIEHRDEKRQSQEYFKKYYKEHREEILNQQKEYYQQNKEKRKKNSRKNGIRNIQTIINNTIKKRKIEENNMKEIIRLASIDALYSNIFVFKYNYLKEKINIVIKRYSSLNYPYFEILFKNALNRDFYKNYLSFSIYRKHENITKIKNISAYIDKEILYVYFKKEEGYKIDYDKLYSLFYLYNITKYKNKKDNNEIELDFKSFFDYITNNSNPINISYLIKLIKEEKKKNQLKGNSFERDKKLSKIFNNGGI